MYKIIHNSSNHFAGIDSGADCTNLASEASMGPLRDKLRNNKNSSHVSPGRIIVKYILFVDAQNFRDCDPSPSKIFVKV